MSVAPDSAAPTLAPTLAPTPTHITPRLKQTTQLTPHSRNIRETAFTRAQRVLEPFVSAAQFAQLFAACDGDEGDYFIELIKEFGQRIETMPQTYDQDGAGDGAIVHLHYFAGGSD